MLLQEYDSPNLRILAGLDRRNSIFEAEAYFVRALKELNLEAPEPKVAVRAYGCEIAQQIIDGKFTSSRQSVRALYQMWLDTLWLDTDYAADYTIWVQLDDALDNLESGGFPYSYPSATLENFDAIVKQEAATFIAKMSS